MAQGLLLLSRSVDRFHCLLGGWLVVVGLFVGLVVGCVLVAVCWLFGFTCLLVVRRIVVFVCFDFWY